MKISRIGLHAAFGVLLMVGFAGSTVTAAGSKPAATKSSDSSSSSGQQTAGSGGSVQGYAADSALQNGTIVQLTGGGTAKVSPASSKNPNQMYGVTVDPHNLTLTISNSAIANQVYVATSGTYEVLVSNQAGAVKAGDYITISAIDGVGMDAGTDGTTVFGRAAAGFDGKNNAVGTSTLKLSNGASQTVGLGIIPVAINIQRNPNEKSTKANLPKALQRIGQAVAEKPIGPLRIYLSLIITGLSIIVAIVTLYSGIRNSIISIGRNPLGKKAIFRGLLEIILTAFIILIIGLFAVYLLLKL